MKLSELLSIAPYLPSDTEISIGNVSAAGNIDTAYWKVWDGWRGNHDQRIEDATCSNCGYMHPETVYGSLSKLPKYCAGCRSEMSTKEE